MGYSISQGPCVNSCTVTVKQHVLLHTIPLWALIGYWEFNHRNVWRAVGSNPTSYYDTHAGSVFQGFWPPTHRKGFQHNCFLPHIIYSCPNGKGLIIFLYSCMDQEHDHYNLAHINTHAHTHTHMHTHTLQNLHAIIYKLMLTVYQYFR